MNTIQNPFTSATDTLPYKDGGKRHNEVSSQRKSMTEEHESAKECDAGERVNRGERQASAVEHDNELWFAKKYSSIENEGKKKILCEIGVRVYR